MSYHGNILISLSISFIYRFPVFFSCACFALFLINQSILFQAITFPMVCENYILSSGTSLKSCQTSMIDHRKHNLFMLSGGKVDV